MLKSEQIVEQQQATHPHAPDRPGGAVSVPSLFGLGDGFADFDLEEPDAEACSREQLAQLPPDGGGANVVDYEGGEACIRPVLKVLKEHTAAGKGLAIAGIVEKTGLPTDQIRAVLTLATGAKVAQDGSAGFFLSPERLHEDFE